MNDNLGKQAESKIKEWLDRPEDGYCFDRLYDQMSGFYGSRNISDFTLFKSPNFYYIESKATWEDRFEFSRITDTQYNGMLKKSEMANVFGIVIVLFATHRRAFIIDVNSISDVKSIGQKSINITKIDKWRDYGLRYMEIPTAPNSRTKLPTYDGDFEVLINCMTNLK